MLAIKQKPVICIASGLFTQKKREIIGIDFFDKIDLFLTPNLFAPYDKSIINSKNYYGFRMIMIG